MSAALNNDYRVARQAQDAAYEDATGLPIGDTNRQEYRDYFGIGDAAGVAVETRVTPQRWLVEHRGEARPDWTTPREALQMTGDQLALLAESGDCGAADEIVRRAINRTRKKMAA